MLRSLIKNKYLLLHVLCFAIVLVYRILNGGGLNSIIWTVLGYIFPTAIVWFLTKNKIVSFHRRIDSYIVFFIPWALSTLGMVRVLGSSDTAWRNPIFYGASFYSAYLSFFLFNRKDDPNVVWKSTNPILLISGPIAYRFLDRTLMSIRRRLNYFTPYIIVGVFFVNVVAQPLKSILIPSMLEKWATAVIYACIFEVYVYFNFCGFSMLAFGILGLLGFRIPMNFRQPFSSRNIVEFWKGWHVSLSKILKTIFYGPLRRKNQSLAIIGVFIASGLWHGSSVNFVLWGGFHGGVYIFTLGLVRAGYMFIPQILLPFTLIFGRLLFALNDLSVVFTKKFYTSTSLAEHFGIVNTRSLIACTIGLMLIISEYVFKNHRLFTGRRYKYLRLNPVLTIVTVLIFMLLAFRDVSEAVYGNR